MIPGQRHFPNAYDAEYLRIFAGAAWPALRAGWVVVVGEHRREQVGGLPRLDVLDEATDERLWHVVSQLAALREYYHPEHVLADGGHVAAMQFAAQYRAKGLVVEHALLCEMKGPLAYALPVLKRLLDTQRLIVPPGSGLAGELLVPPSHEDPGSLLLSDYPGVAALAFAVLSLEETRRDPRAVVPTEMVRGEGGRG